MISQERRCFIWLIKAKKSSVFSICLLLRATFVGHVTVWVYCVSWWSAFLPLPRPPPPAPFFPVFYKDFQPQSRQRTDSTCSQPLYKSIFRLLYYAFHHFTLNVTLMLCFSMLHSSQFSYVNLFQHFVSNWHFSYIKHFTLHQKFELPLLSVLHCNSICWKKFNFNFSFTFTFILKYAAKT